MKTILAIIASLLFATQTLAFDYYGFGAESLILSEGCIIHTNEIAYQARYVDTGTVTSQTLTIDFDITTNVSDYVIWQRLADDPNEDPLHFTYIPTETRTLQQGPQMLVVIVPTNSLIDHIVITNDELFDANQPPKDANGHHLTELTPRYTNQFNMGEYFDITMGWHQPTIDQDNTDPCNIIAGTNRYDNLTYNLYHGTTSGIYNVINDTGTNLQYRISGLNMTNIYYVAVTSVEHYSTNSSSESAFSCEIQITKRLPPFTIDTPSGTYTNSVTVSVTHTEYPDTTIYYTLDGSPAYTNTLVYTDPITITDDTILTIQGTYGPVTNQVEFGTEEHINKLIVSAPQIMTYNIIPTVTKPGRPENLRRVD